MNSNEMDQDEIKTGVVFKSNIEKEDDIDTRIEIEVLCNKGNYELVILAQGSFKHLGVDLTVLYSIYISRILSNSGIKIISIKHIEKIGHDKISISYNIERSNDIFYPFPITGYVEYAMNNRTYLIKTKQMQFIIESIKRINKLIKENDI